MKRRNFIKSSALASTALFTPAFLKGSVMGRKWNSRSGKVLVVIQLSGGNDGLNTIIPYQNDIYYQLRPKLAISKNEVLPVAQELGFHPSLASLRPLYDNGQLSIINNVGYPNPDRSHFRSMDIWQTGSSSKEYWSTGWLGRYMDSECSACPAYHALEVDDGLSLALKGQLHSGFAMSDAQRLYRTSNNPFQKAIAQNEHNHAEENIAYLYKTYTDTQNAANYLYEQSKVYKSLVDYPKTRFSKDLKQVAELITADTDTKIYYVTLGGFDTHAGQKTKQHNLLKQYAEGVSAFVKDLERNNLMDDTLIMTFSEFGRRVKQNASGGTDHGTANNVFLIGGQLQQSGFYNNGPRLDQLVDQDLQYEIDFRQLYATILDKWLEGDATNVLQGKFQHLNFI